MGDCKILTNRKQNMSTAPTQANIQNLTWSAQSFFHGQTDRGHHYFSEVIQTSPQDANGVYEAMWRIKGSPMGDQQYGMKVFHSLGGLQSNSREKAMAIQNYLITKGIFINTSVNTAQDQNLTETARSEHQTDAQGNYQTQVVYQIVDMAATKWCPDQRGLLQGAVAVASFGFYAVPQIMKFFARTG
jgi:hypothetical protein